MSGPILKRNFQEIRFNTGHTNFASTSVFQFLSHETDPRKNGVSQENNPFSATKKQQQKHIATCSSLLNLTYYHTQWSQTKIWYMLLLVPCLRLINDLLNWTTLADHDQVVVQPLLRWTKHNLSRATFSSLYYFYRYDVILCSQPSFFSRGVFIHVCYHVERMCPTLTEKSAENNSVFLPQIFTLGVLMEPKVTSPYWFCVEGEEFWLWKRAYTFL